VRAGVCAMQAMRVMISGSAALPDPVMTAWKALTGHDLLEVGEQEERVCLSVSGVSVCAIVCDVSVRCLLLHGYM
jgi:hypothetical protein